MEIRFLQESDRDGICRLSYQINSEHYKNEPRYFCEPPVEGSDWAFWRKCNKKERGFLLVCVDDLEVIGFLSAELLLSPDLPFIRQMTRCRIGTLVVSNEHHRKGVGTALFNKACIIAKEGGAEDIGLEVMSFNVSAREFYRNLGFRSLAERMSKELA